MTDRGPASTEAEVNEAQLSQLFSMAEGFVTRGELPSIQVAVARKGRLAGTMAYGNASFAGTTAAVDERTLYSGYSTTKAVVAAAIWLLLEDGVISEGDKVARWIPEFGTNGKEIVEVGQLLTHTAGFPNAPFAVTDWPDRARRLERLASWELEWVPGSQLAYHATSASWVLAELIERCADQPFTRFVRDRVVQPLGLEGFFLGLPSDMNGRVADVVHVGEPPTEQELDNLGLDKSVDRSDDEDYLSGYNRPDWRAIGAPGSGGCTTAASLAMFCQALLSGGVLDGTRVWKEETIASALEVRTQGLTDPMTGNVANKCLGLVIAGDESRMYRGFCPGNSPRAFGHAGVGGQLMWGDPATGLSFALVTNGLVRHPMKMGMRNLMLSSCAVECAK